MKVLHSLVVAKTHTYKDLAKHCMIRKTNLFSFNLSIYLVSVTQQTRVYSMQRYGFFIETFFFQLPVFAVFQDV